MYTKQIMTEKKFYISVFFMFLFSINCFGQGNLQSSIVAKNSIVAHRGAWKKKNLPQNSIASLKEAIRLNCKGSEFDIWLSADDSLVVCHDATYNNLNIQDSKYSQLVTLKLSNGEKLPTLREYIAAAKQNNTTTQLVCHLKDGLSAARKKVFVAKTLECVDKLKAQQLMIYATESYGLLKEIRASNALADIRSFLGDPVLSPEQLKKDNISGAFYYDYAYYKNPEWIESARTNNITLSVSIINDASGINWFLKNNFDAILTDEPELAINLQSLSINVFNSSQLEFKVFPNPASNLVSIRTNSTLPTALSVAMIDESGKTVITKTFPQGSSTCSFETVSLNNGIYFLKIADQDGSKTFKVVINK
jgi:glycerophosphoryl diester phosphodiesterase